MKRAIDTKDMLLHKRSYELSHKQQKIEIKQKMKQKERKKRLI